MTTCPECNSEFTNIGGDELTCPVCDCKFTNIDKPAAPKSLAQVREENGMEPDGTVKVSLPTIEAQPAPEPAAMTQDIAALIVRSVCESDPADPEHADTVCVNVNDLADMIVTHLPASQAAVPELVTWVVDRWHAEVANRPMVNVHRRALDDTWRQVLRHLGVNDRERIGPTHDELRALMTDKEWKAANGTPEPAADAGEVEKDAARYRYLRTNCKEEPLRPASYGSEIAPDMRLKHSFPVLVSYDSIGQQITLDSAIDAAIESIDRKATAQPAGGAQ